MKKSKKRNNSFKRGVKNTKKKGLNRKNKKSKKVRKLSRKQYGGMYGLPPQGYDEPAPEQGAVAQEMDRGEPALDQGPTQIVAQNVKLRNEIKELKDKLSVAEHNRRSLEIENHSLKKGKVPKLEGIAQADVKLKDEIEMLKDELRVSENNRRSLEEENQLLKAGKQLTEIKGQLEETKQKKEELEELKQQLEDNLKEAEEERDDYYEIIEQQRVELDEKDSQLLEAANLVRQFDEGRDQEKEINRGLTGDLNDKGIELEEAKEELEQAQRDLEQANADLELKQAGLDELIIQNTGLLEQVNQHKLEIEHNKELLTNLDEFREELALTKEELERQREFNVLLNEQIERTSSSEEEDNPEREDEARVLIAENTGLKETKRELEGENSGLQIQLNKLNEVLTSVEKDRDNYFIRAEKEMGARISAEKVAKKKIETLTRQVDTVTAMEEKIVELESNVNDLRAENNKLNEDKRMLETKLANISSTAEIYVRERQANSKSKEENERLRQGLEEIHELAKQQSPGVSAEETDFSFLNDEQTLLVQRIMGIKPAIE